ncbi:PPOX class F420-dependent oxidoreductase [Streptomyces sp. GC420]|uniref:PPOX class F420-dependent oxidoreductase n=1 Tax=Streptomyces sp. GC420 TaxID=2697568 RepID=UPI0014151D6B|nr:PPOX class F420-dependent oxidoreductase [Streptomyces sp. GC420]NBM19136.1 PPOX class F420-dependent oxidoreductase [Streptomyces sp. GC420]
MTTATLDELGRSPYISLTTFRRDGTGVATPVWCAADDGVLYVWTRSDSWKVKRIRNNGRATVVPCDVRGRPVAGAEPVEGTARLLDPGELAGVRGLLSRKYRWRFWLVDRPAAWARLGKRPHTAIAFERRLAGPSGSL